MINNNKRQNNFITYLLFLTVSALIVSGFAFFHHFVVLSMPLAEILPVMFLIPIIVGLFFGFFLAKMRLMKGHSDFQVELLHNQENLLSDLNKSLEQRVKARSKKLSDTQKLTQNILDSTDNIVVLTNGLQTQTVNRAFFRFFSGFKNLEEFNEKHGCLCDFFIEDKEDENGQFIGKLIEDETWVKHISQFPRIKFRALIRYQDKSYIFDIRVRSLVLKDELLYVATLSDITELISFKNKLEASAEKLKRQLFYDGLTGLPNRTKLLVDIKESRDASLMLIDIDSFKEINDYFSHEVGDLILKKVAGQISITLDDTNETLYRISGDEFAVLINKDNSGNNLKKRAELIVKAIIDKSYIVPGESEIIINISMGIIKSGLVTKDRLMSCADIAMKTARVRHKIYLFYDESLISRKEHKTNLQIIGLLNTAINEDRVFIHIQPIMNNETETIDKYECLVRLEDSSGTIILPVKFLKAAKTAKLYPYITRQVVEKACQTFQELDYEFSINISIDDILNPETVDFIFAAVKKYNVGSRLVFEILESEGMEDLPEIQNFVKNIKKLGCKIAIDDFGAGYSNFDHILRLDVDYLKIDASLIKNMTKDANSTIIVETIHDFARKLGIKTVGEYIHSEEVFNAACKIGLDYSQGYFIGEPEAANFNNH